MKKLWIKCIAICIISFSLYFLNLMNSFVISDKLLNFPALSAYNKNNFEKCSSKVTKIGFLKTHKCSSTTLQNILIRFAIFNNLNIVLPQLFVDFNAMQAK